MKKRVNRLLDGIEVVRIDGNPEREIENITYDSRKCTAGSLFIAVNGTDVNGHDFIGKAIEAGATAVVYQEGDLAFDGVTTVKVADSRKALALVADNYYDHPSSKLELVGITGTNGKSTTVTLLYDLFTALGYSCGLLSTIVNKVDGIEIPASQTTPDPVSLNSMLAQMNEHGCQYCFMEISSHSLAQDRVAGLKFKGGIFSNITHDHLDYHKTFAEYLRCKKSFFDNLPEDAFALTNADDKNGMVMVQNTKAEIKTYSCHKMADFRCRIIEEGLDGMLLEMDGKQFWSRFIGAHNTHNLLAVYGTAMMLGADSDEVLVKMSALGCVPGRLEYIRGGKDLTVAVDYAHTPDGLENVLKTLREAGRDRMLICVFGCGGNRDRTKRPEMGVIAAKYADRVVVTSDNPRKEDPDAIIAEIRDGMDAKMRAKSIYITDRREAIRTAMMTAPEGAVILVAGKGHEDYQIIGETKFHFDDREVVREIFKEM
ncbi:MAG: UDP-N-acetylmuramoyl-L-alanyl-D-glutamate--2,6-diaminopimelate ligase [Bacteroidales bacterium]|nr:UDP-N-acetylmuramoyl-L-alanyl-D-glutamate--2,6-diaminopimelate ligase [Bacteroidales bacterium]